LSGTPEPPDLIVVGDLMLDVSVEAAALKKGGDVHGQVRVRPAGAGANAAVWAAYSGARVRLYGRVGADPGGRVLVEALRERSVEPAFIVDTEAPTGAMLVLTQQGERTMVADRGANARLSPDDLPESLEAGAVLVSGYLLFHPGSEDAARAALARARAPWVAVDAASWPMIDAYGADRFFEATAQANLLLANEREAAALFGGKASEGTLGPRLPYEHVYTKRGPDGATHAHGTSITSVTGTPVPEPVDPTGAGDAFDGVLLAALARGEDQRAALEEACSAGERAVMSHDTWPER
jgi:sugar/nucleoside kinase (ribokinase family)